MPQGVFSAVLQYCDKNCLRFIKIGACEWNTTPFLFFCVSHTDHRNKDSEDKGTLYYLAKSFLECTARELYTHGKKWECQWTYTLTYEPVPHHTFKQQYFFYMWPYETCFEVRAEQKSIIIQSWSESIKWLRTCKDQSSISEHNN